MSSFPTIQMAPLAGITDIAFRRLVQEYGADLTFTEMVNVKGLYYRDRGSRELLLHDPQEKTVGIQIFGSDEDIIEEVIQRDLNPLDWPICLDFNLGCPAPKIVKNGEGAFLLTQPKKVASIMKRVVEASRFPVSAKFRLGFDQSSVNYLEIGKILESVGVQSITLHARTRESYYAGKADWNAIRQLVEAVNIPVIGNGDIYHAQDALRMLEETGCRGVMVARGALGNPFLFRQIQQVLRGEDPEPITIGERLETLYRHYHMIQSYKPEHVAVREMRKHAAWYLKGLPGSNTIKHQINSARDMEQVMELLEQFGAELGGHVADEGCLSS